MACIDARQCLRALIDRSPVSLLVTNGPSGSPAIRPMGTVLVDDGFTVWFATGRTLDKCAQIQADNRVTVYWQVPDTWDYGEITGTAELVDSPELRERFWREEWAQFFAGGKADPQLIFIKVTPTRGVCHHMKDWSTHTIEF